MFTGWTRVQGSTWHPVVTAPTEAQTWDLLRRHVEMLGTRTRFLDTFVGPAGTYPGRRLPVPRPKENPMPNRPSTHRPDRPTPRRGKRPYDLRKWRGIRARYLASHPVCEAPGCGRLATEVDHKDGDATHNQVSNFQALCKACHSRKTVACDGGLGRSRHEHGQEAARSGAAAAAFIGWTRLPGKHWQAAVTAETEDEACRLLRAHLEQLPPESPHVDTFIAAAGVDPRRPLPTPLTPTEEPR